MRIGLTLPIRLVRTPPPVGAKHTAAARLIGELQCCHHLTDALVSLNWLHTHPGARCLSGGRTDIQGSEWDCTGVS